MNTKSGILSTPIPTQSQPSDPKSLLRSRILSLAHSTLFSQGFSPLNLDLLSSDLGISKKTLYTLFPSKDSLASTVISSLESQVQSHTLSIFQQPNLPFTEKLHQFTSIIIQRLSHLQPHALRDIQRFAPHLYDQILTVRQRNIPNFFSQLIRDGQTQGMIRPDIDPIFAAHFILHAIQGLMSPASLDLLQHSPSSTFQKAIQLVFQGLLTSSGQKQYEKLQHA